MYVFVCKLCGHVNVLSSKSETLEYAYRHLLKCHNVFIDLMYLNKMLKRRRTFETNHFYVQFLRSDEIKDILNISTYELLNKMPKHYLARQLRKILHMTIKP